MPPGVDLLAVVDRGVGATAGDRDGPAVGGGGSGERPAPAGPGGGGPRDGGDELEIDLRSLDTVARWVAGYGPDVVVLHPPELAAAVRRAWAGVAAAHARRPRRRFRPRAGVGAGWREAVR